jgi:Na+/H+-dicarboxylate symporter
MNVLKNYAFTICLITGIVIGGVCGILFKNNTSCVKPIGDLFLNMMFVMIVPLVFLSVSSAIYNMKKKNMIGKVLGCIILVFLGSAIIAAVTAYVLTLFYNPLSNIDKATLLAHLPSHVETKGLTTGEIFVNTFTVPDFLDLFSKSNLLPLIVFSVFFGLAASYSKEHGKTVADLLETGLAIVLRMMRIIMYFAPIGLGCYFAYTIGEVGSQILNGYLNAFVLYLVLAAFCFFILNPFYIWLAGGKKGFINFWRHILTPSLTAIATSSSAVCIPINIETAEKLGVPPSIAETVIPLGTNMHKDGSVMGGIIKIVFILTIFGESTQFSVNGLLIIAVAILVGAVMGAIPSGGMTGELLICSVFGFSPQLAATLMVISTIIDIPATLLNSTGNIVSSVLVARLTRSSHPSSLQ